MPQRCVFFLLIPAVVSFALGIYLVHFTFFAIAGLVLWAIALIAVLASVAISIVASAMKTTRWQIVGGVLGLLGGSLIPVWIGWFEYVHRPKPDTVGYAEFNPRSSSPGRNGVLIRLDLPQRWRVRYNIRHAPSFSQGTVTDDHGRLRLDAYARLRAWGGKPLRVEEYARQTTERAKKAGLEPERAEYREAPWGRCWTYRAARPNGDFPFWNEPAVDVEYAAQWGEELLLFRFGILAVEVVELEPLSWQLVRTAQVHASEQAE